MWRYGDFLAVSEDFIPVFSEEVDKNHQGNWKFYIPHAQMRNLLEKLIAALERAHGGDKRSLWLTGAYGTGKTYASFVVKHLLEDDLEAIEDYFQKHQILTPLWPRFKALRQNNRCLVIYRSASGYITSNRRLMMEVQQAIKDQLQSRGYSNAFSESLMDQLVNKLSDPSGIFNWEAAFTKYRGRFRTAAAAEEVIERLRAGDVRLGEQVAAVLEEEGLTLVDSPAAVKAWIKEVIAANDLQGIVFIWDEFTEFFANNVPVTPLQELAQATADMPFYLFLVTHRALNQFTRIDEDTRKKLLDRFHNCQLEMTPVTAYKLIANVIEAQPDRRSEWEAKLDSLWSKVDVAVFHINVLGERVNKDDLKRMAPIHPFTAYLLATISSLYSSSQRTLFQFLKTEAPGSFQWFIANYPQDNWYWLTPEYLWQYFFEDVKIESIEAISDLLSHYRSARDSLSEEELRVFRVMLLLIALWRQTQGAHDLLKPSLSVLKRMFVGTELYQRVGEVADGLCARGVMLAVPAGNDCEYIIPTNTIDQAKLEECRRRAETTLTLEKMIRAGSHEAGFASELKGLLSLLGAAKLRHPVEIISARELKLRRERVLQGVERPYEVGVILVAQEDEHFRRALAELIEQVMKGFKLSENYTIRKMSAQGERFCQMARDVFRLTPEQAAYPEEARKNMRKTFMEMGYPLWALVYYVQGTSGPSPVRDMARAAEALGEILAYAQDELGDREMEAVVEAVKPVRHELSRLLSRDRTQEGIKKFWEVHAPRLTSLMAALRLDVFQVMSRLRALLNRGAGEGEATRSRPRPRPGGCPEYPVRGKETGPERAAELFFTGSASPERWSEERGTPIQRVLEGHAHHNFSFAMTIYTGCLRRT
ncbi:MAG: hypothetical protein D9V47_12060 [Clostridia bacterium]|nr:MAG: hypothetical protein D9V47_12060 [Clostridia bacterium]